MKPARIIVLFIAIAAGGVAALLAGRSEQAPPPPPPAAPVVQLETTDVLVANTDISTGNSISEQDLRWQTWPAAAVSTNFIRRNDRPDAATQLAGTIARVSFSNGEPIREAKLIRANGSGYMAAILPTGMRAVSTDITPERGAGGFILPNDHVDVILTRHDKDAEKANGGTEVQISETILSNVRVLAIGKTVEERNNERTVDGTVATLELTPSMAERLTLAHQLGTISLVLRSLVDSGPQKLAEKTQRADAIVVYRGADVEAYSCTPMCDHHIVVGGMGSQFSDGGAADASSAAPPRPAPQ